MDDKQFNELTEQLQKLSADSDEQRDQLKAIAKAIQDLNGQLANWAKAAKQDTTRGSY